MPRKLLLLPGMTFASHRLPIASAALQRGFEVHVGAPAGARPGDLEHPNLHHHTIGISRAPKSLRREASAIMDLRALLGSLRPDVVHLFTPRVIATAGPIVRMHKDAALVATITGLGYTFLYDGSTAGAIRWGVSQAFRFTFSHPRAHVIVQNHDDLHELSIRRVLDPDRATLIPGSGVDVDQFQPPTHRDNTPPLVVLASRLLWDKGVGEFVEAARLLRARGHTARFVLVGEPDRENPRFVPKESIERWVEAGVVEAWGYRQDMPHVLAQADVFCLPSYREGMPRVLLEAAAAGCAIVTTNAPGGRELIDSGKNGLLVPPRDAGELADAIASLLTDASKREAFGRAARERVEQMFTSERIARQVLAVYDGLLEV